MTHNYASICLRGLLLTCLLWAGTWATSARAQIVLQESFESGFPPAGWKLQTVTGNSWKQTNLSDGVASSGVRSAYHSSSPSNDANAWMFTRKVRMIGGKYYRIEVEQRVQSRDFPERFEVQAARGQSTDSLLGSVLYAGTNLTNAAFVNRIGNYFIPDSTGNYCFGFHATSPQGSFTLYLDNVRIYEVTPDDKATCPEVETPVDGATVSRRPTFRWKRPVDVLTVDVYLSTSTFAGRVYPGDYPATERLVTDTRDSVLTLADALAENTTYYLKLVPKSAFAGSGNLSTSCTQVVFATGTDPGYCVPSATNCQPAIKQVALAEVVNNSDPTGCTTGYQDFTGTVFTLQRDAEYPLTVQVNNGVDQRVGVWVDLNANGLFGDAGDSVYVLTTRQQDTLSVASTTLRFPDVLGNRTVRMRIRVGQAGQLQPCGALPTGQAEDYTLTLTENTCPSTLTNPQAALDFPDASQVQVAFSWQDANVQNYRVRYRALTTPIWQEATATGALTASVLIPADSAGLRYVFQVRTDCGAGNSPYTADRYFYLYSPDDDLVPAGEVTGCARLNETRAAATALGTLQAGTNRRVGGRIETTNGTPDVDWFKFVVPALTESTAEVSVTLSNASFPASVAFAYADGTLFQGDSLADVSGSYGGTSARLEPGTWYVRVSTTVFAGYACEGAYGYRLNLRLNEGVRNDSVNTVCSQALALDTGGTARVGRPVTATRSLPGCDGRSGNDLWYTFTPRSTVDTLYVRGVNGFDPVVRVFEGSCTGQLVVCQNRTRENGTEVVTLDSIAKTGVTYYVQVFYARDTVLVGDPAPYFTIRNVSPLRAVNDECENAIELTVGTGRCDNPVIGNLKLASQSAKTGKLSNNECSGTGNGRGNVDMWYLINVPPNTQSLVVATQEAEFSPWMEVYGSSNICTEANPNEKILGCGPSVTLNNLVSGSKLYVRMRSRQRFSDISSAATLRFGICVYPGPPANDACAGAIDVPLPPTGVTTVTGSTRLATGTDEASLDFCGGEVALGLWYKFRGDGKRVTLSFENNTAAANPDSTRFAVYETSGPGAVCGRLRSCVQQTIAGQKKLVFDSKAGTDYLLVVSEPGERGIVSFDTAFDNNNVPVRIDTTFFPKGGDFSFTLSSQCRDLPSGFTFLWTGGSTNRNWTNGGNWCGGTAPSNANSSVVIPAVAASAAPLIAANTTVSVKNLRIEAGGRVDVTGSLDLYGNIENNGELRTNASNITQGVVTVKGDPKDGAQRLYGASTLSRLNVLRLENKLRVEKRVEILRSLDLGNDTLLTVETTAPARTGEVVLQSGSGGNDSIPRTAWLEPVTGTGALAGIKDGVANPAALRVTMQRNFDARLTLKQTYVYVATPIKGQTVNDWSDDVSTELLLRYDPTRSDVNDGWVQISAGNALPVGQGHALRVPQISQGSQSNRTLANTGTPHVGDFTWTLRRGDVGGFGDGKLNLLGNPYPAPIKWSKIGTLPTGLDNALYFWNGGQEKYESVVGNTSTNTRYSDTISSGQAFFVRVQQDNVTLTVTEQVKATTNEGNPFRLGPPANLLRITLRDDDTYNDAAVVVFQPAATAAFEGSYDAVKLYGAHLNVATRAADGTYLAIDQRPLFLTTDTLPLLVTATREGSHTLSLGEMETFDAGTRFFLEDRLTGRFTELTAALPDYPFTVSDDPATVGERFRLVFVAPNVTDAPAYGTTAGFRLYPNPTDGQLLSVATSGLTGPRAELTLFDVMGRVVYRRTLPLGGSNLHDTVLNDLRLTKGIYQVQLATDGQRLTQKLVVQ